MGEEYSAKRSTILVVDDTPDNLSLMKELLGHLYKVKLANSGASALKVANSETPPDLILLDIMMPEMDGYEVCERLKHNPLTRDIPIIFLTAKNDVEDERKGLELGAVDYITKPISPPILFARVKTQLHVKATQDFLKDKNSFLEQEVDRRIKELVAIQDVTILALASLAETRDSDTGNHIRRTQYYVRILAEHLQTHPSFASFLTEYTITMIFKSAPLHDIGKVGIPDRILLKPMRLTPVEFEIMKAHPMLGRQSLEHAEVQLGMGVDFLKLAKQIAQSHHERWDGSGYPEGLAGEAIPIAARIMAIADVYDALTTGRIYKEGMTHEQAVGIIEEERGTHFDPEIVQAFLEVQGEFRAVAQEYADRSNDLLKQAAYFAVLSGENI